MNPLSAGWRDVFGNTFGQLVYGAMIQIVSEEPFPWRYNQDLYPPLVIREAVRQLDDSRRRPAVPPIPATPEDLISFELRALIELFAGSSHPVGQQNARGCRETIQAIEAQYPGTLAKIEAGNPGTLAAAGLGRRAAAA